MQHEWVLSNRRAEEAAPTKQTAPALLPSSIFYLCGYIAAMSTATKLIGKVKNGVIPLPRRSQLAEGTSVALIPLVPLSDDPSFLKLALRLAKPRGWPRDFALNHGHYTKGHRKK